MENLSTINIIKNSIKYSLSNMTVVIGFGIILTIITFFEENPNFLNSLPIWLNVISIIALIFFSIVEAGYCYRIIKSTLRKKNTLPEFDKLSLLLKDGTVDLIVTGIYFIIEYFLFNYIMSMMKTDIKSFIIIIVTVIILIILDIFWYLSLINLARYDGKFISAFYLKDLLKLFKNLKLTHILIMILTDLLYGYIIEINLTINYTNFSNIILLFILNLIIAPFSIIFTKRFSTIASLRIKEI